MRHTYSSVTPAAVRALAKSALAAARPWAPFGRSVTAPRLLDLLLLVAALGTSLSAACRRFRFGFSHETARKAVAHNLPADPAELAAGLVDALFRFGDRSWRRAGRWVVALDLHHAPFYGRPGTPGVVGGPKKGGTKWSYAYATAVLVHRRARYTVGLVPITGGLRPHEVVAALLDQLGARGVRPRGVVLDAGFGTGDVILLLRKRRLGYVVPLGRKGGGANRRNDLFGLPAGTVTRADWDTRSGRRVATRVAVVRRAGRPGVRVLAFGGWDWAAAGPAARRADRAAGLYRRRFGIETSYRQMNEGKGRTTKKDVGYRLLLVGVALLVRQAWAWVTRQAARGRGLGPRAWVGDLPLRRVLGWLADALTRRYAEARRIDLGIPITLPDGRSTA